MKKLKLSSSFIQRYRLLLTLILTLVVGLCGYKVYETTVQAAIDPVLIPVAARYLKSGTVIQREDIQMIEVPRPVVLEGVEKDPELLLGQAVDTYNAIAEGSLFYEALLIPKEELHDVSAFPLLENEAAVTIDADIKTSYANSILPGHQIDLYFQGYATQADESEKRVLYGQRVSQARVIAVRDSTGKNIDAQSDKATSVIVVALAYEDADLVQRAKFFGTVLPMVTYGSLNPESQAEDFYDIAKMRELLYQKTIDVSLVKEALEDE